MKNRFASALILATLSGLAATSFGGCGSDNNTASPPTSPPGAQPGAVATEVSIIGRTFNPSRTSVSEGTTVHWTNTDRVAHTVTSSTGAFDSGIIPPGGTYQFTFKTAGQYRYTCTIHPEMQGEIEVTSGTSTGTSTGSSTGTGTGTGIGTGVGIGHGGSGNDGAPGHT